MMERSTLMRVSGGDLRRRDDKEEGSRWREKTRWESWERGERVMWAEEWLENGGNGVHSASTGHKVELHPLSSWLNGVSLTFSKMVIHSPGKFWKGFNTLVSCLEAFLDCLINSLIGLTWFNELVNCRSISVPATFLFFSLWLRFCMRSRPHFSFLLGAKVPVFCYSFSFASCSVLIVSIPDISLPALMYSPNIFPSFVLRHVDSLDPASALNTSGLSYVHV